MTIPNFISLGRVILVPVIFYLLLSNQTEAAFYVFLVAGISDAVDGFLAKRFGWTSELGAYLDPLADKLLLVSLFAAMGQMGLLPLWLAIAVISRDILIVLGVTLTWMLGQPVNIKPHTVSKANTFSQIILVATVLADQAFKLGLDTVVLVLVWLTFALTIASLGAYTVAWIRHMSGEAPEQP
jgi:cardiolipin synthase (CMP-forming)